MGSLTSVSPLDWDSRLLVLHGESGSRDRVVSYGICKVTLGYDGKRNTNVMALLEWRSHQDTDPALFVSLYSATSLDMA